MTKPSEKLSKIRNRSSEDQRNPKIRIRVGMATCGISAGADSVYEAFKTSAENAGLNDITIIPTGCVGRCDLEPLAEVTRAGEPPVLYIKLDKEKVERIVKEHLVEGKSINEYAG